MLYSGRGPLRDGLNEDKEVEVTAAGLPLDERQMILDLLAQVRERMLTPEKLREWDRQEIFPEAEIRELLGPEIGFQLLFIPEEYGGFGGGARDLAAFSEQMAKICLGVGTALLVIHLGSDPILVAGTDVQKQKWLTKVAEEGSIVAYAVTEAEAGSNLSNIKTNATPVLDDAGAVTGYRINGTKQFISSGGYADFLTVLAQTPEGPAFFIVEKTMPGFIPGRPEEKHGIRSSNTSALTFDDVFVPLENLVGGVLGQGLSQANEVFGFTRLMVACCGLGAGVAALEKVIPYAKERVQFGSPLMEKQGYTHKLVLPFVARLEAARAYIEEVALRLDSGETDLQVEGAIAKLFATEVGNSCADAAIQALGGYGYTVEYDVEKIKRDVKITTIYEGTSEIQQLIVGTSRWRDTVRSKGLFYGSLADQMEAVHADCGDVKADVFGALARLLNRLFDEVHQAKLTRQQHIMFRLATLTTLVETGAALGRKAAQTAESSENREYLKLCARINAALVAQEAFAIANEVLYGSGQWSTDEARAILDSSSFDYPASQTGLIADMDLLRTRI
jgi:alkylation response protein AidB-like acyl-CoA dehydrogenase